MMKRYLLGSFIVLTLIVGVTMPALADTIRLKDGSVIRGQIVSFKNEQFTILVGSGARGRKSQITVYMEDVESIEFDSTGPADTRTNSNTDTQPPYQPPSNPRPSNPQPTQPNNSSNPTFF